MFCVKCGTQLPDGSMFCSQCGTKLENNSASTPYSDTNKVLKEGKFKNYKKYTDMLSKKNDGILTLFCDRLEWKGREDATIKINDIKTAKCVLIMGSEQALEITAANKTYKFMIMTDVLARATDVTLAGNMNKIATEIESWRSTIDTLRGRM